ncbi:uncharacterized protein LOC134188476 [Corticium candelabrum]|uniref:uncharacterized protein LOC134188476 n=1 Tax=Corticium candelabrum TaxID=121492 RepID=UPI002E269CEC|nr:uncharacterized protein LOC134188476 [Corticium candelabrum]
MTIDHPDHPNIVLGDRRQVQRSSTKHLPLFSTGGEDGDFDQKMTVRSSYLCESIDCVGESPPPVPPRPPETINSDSSSPDSPLEVWPPLEEAGTVGMMRRGAFRQTSRSEGKEARELKRFSSTIAVAQLVPIQRHPPLRSCKSEAEDSITAEPTKVSRTLSDGAIKIRRSISAIFRRRSSGTKTHEPRLDDIASPEKVAEHRRERLRYALFPNSGEIQFAKKDDAPPPLPPRNCREQDQEFSPPPRQLKKSRSVQQRLGSFTSKEATKHALLDS